MAKQLTVVQSDVMKKCITGCPSRSMTADERTIAMGLSSEGWLYLKVIDGKECYVQVQKKRQLVGRLTDPALLEKQRKQNESGFDASLRQGKTMAVWNSEKLNPFTM